MYIRLRHHGRFFWENSTSIRNALRAYALLTECHEKMERINYNIFNALLSY